MFAFARQFVHAPQPGGKAGTAQPAARPKELLR